MSYEPVFHGGTWTSRGPSGVVEMVNILARGKWIKADSDSVDKFLSNMQLVQDAGEFAFYSRPDSAVEMDRIVREHKAGEKRFSFHISAFLNESSAGTVHSATLDCTGCELLFATGFPLSIGLRFETSNFWNRAVSRRIGHPHRHTRGGHDYRY